MALYAQLCRTMGFSPFGTLRQQDHQQVLALKSGEIANEGGGGGDHTSRRLKCCTESVSSSPQTSGVSGPVKRPNLGEHRFRDAPKKPPAKGKDGKPAGPPLLLPVKKPFGYVVMNPSGIIEWVGVRGIPRAS